MIADGSHTYTYDGRGHLAKVDGGNTASYTYDALGRRVEKIQGTNQTHYWYDADGNVRVQWNQNGIWMVDYLYLNGQFVLEYYAGTTYFVHTDHLGSTRVLTGLNQAVVQNLDYLPFGELNSTDSGISTHKFTGDEHDAETSFEHTQFRQYTSSLARWMSPDPAGLAAVDPTNPQSWNRYAYVLNNPMALVDPLGLGSCGAFVSCVISPNPDPGPGGINDIFLFGVDIGRFCPAHLFDGGCFTGGGHNLGDDNGTGRKPSMRPAPQPHPPCQIVDPVPGALEFTLKAGFGAEVGKFQLDASIYKNVTTGEQGSEATADVGLAAIKVVNPTPYTGNFTGNTGGPQITASFMGREKNLTTGAHSVFNPSKIFKLGASFFAGFEISFNGDKYSQLVAANAACRAAGGK